jgi:sortase B
MYHLILSISLPIVQTADNDYYLNHSFKKKNSTQGAAFVDCRNLLSDTNITIYGHYVYADTSKMFSPLTKLKKKENYEKHNLLRLHFRDETRTYQIAYVYEYDYTTTDYDYTVRNFGTETKFYNFFKYPRQQRYYDTEVEMEYGDRILTLQTCVRNQEDKRLIVVAKEIEEKK